MLEGSIKETEEALRLLRISFEEGEISFTGIYVVQGQLVSLKDELAQSKGDVVTSLIGIYKALGGGWEVRCAPHPTYDEWWLEQSAAQSLNQYPGVGGSSEADREGTDDGDSFVPPLPAPPALGLDAAPEQGGDSEQVPTSPQDMNQGNEDKE